MTTKEEIIRKSVKIHEETPSETDNYEKIIIQETAKAIFEELKRRISKCHTVNEKVVMFIVLDEEKKWIG
jgi:hypothetical protein